jgi:hypothetical protein
MVKNIRIIIFTAIFIMVFLPAGYRKQTQAFLPLIQQVVIRKVFPGQPQQLHRPKPRQSQRKKKRLRKKKRKKKKKPKKKKKNRNPKKPSLRLRKKTSIPGVESITG